MTAAAFIGRSALLSILSWTQAALLQSVGWYKSVRHARSRPGEGLAAVRILVIQLANVGDFVLSRPLFEALRQTYSERLYLAVLVNGTNAPLAAGCGAIDEVFVYDSAKYTRTRVRASFAEVRGMLDEGAFTQIFWLRGDLTILAWSLGRKARFGSIALAPNSMRRSWLAILRGRPAGPTNHYVQALDRLTDGSACRPSSCTDAWQVAGDSVTRSGGLASGREVVVHVGSGSPLRTLPVDFLAQVVDRLLARVPDCVVTLLGAEEDRGRAAEILATDRVRAHGARVSNACGATPLAQLGSYLQRAALYIGVDSGPLHIAAGVGTPVVGLYGPQSPALFGPWGSGPHRVLYGQRTCSPCWQFGCLHVRSGLGACLAAIEPDEVCQEAVALLASES